ncbi:MAG: hypothetical protein HPY79_11030 [Bacteroidales bacterium]|nr:hypothetical protein [Bacteroidales bacterium]
METINQTIQEAQKQLESGNTFMAMVLLALCLEWMGALLDDKPLKSTKQSKRRFNKAVACLLGGKYAALNRDSFLYEYWRNQLIHSGKLSKRFFISDDPINHHLCLNENKQWIFIPSVFLRDMQAAFAKLEKIKKAEK